MRKGHTKIVVLLDRSGSMSSIAQPTVDGFNEFLREQQSAPGTADITLVQFDSAYEPNYADLDIRDAKPLYLDRNEYFRSREDAVPFSPRGMTALNDSMARLIKETGDRLSKLSERNRPERVIFVSITDGGENQSREFGGSEGTRRVREMVRHQEEVYSWEFIYLGANQDAVSVGTNLGIKAANSMTYAANAVGASAAYESLSKNVIRARVGQSAAFDAEDLDKQARAGVGVRRTVAPQPGPTAAPTPKAVPSTVSSRPFDKTHPNWRKRGPGGKFSGR